MSTVRQNTQLMKLYEILIPTTDNDGVKISIGQHKKWDEWIVQRCGGLTLLKTFKGKWQNQEEEMIPVRIACYIYHLDDILDFTAKFYDQKAVMMYEISPNVMIYNRPIK